VWESNRNSGKEYDIISVNVEGSVRNTCQLVLHVEGSVRNHTCQLVLHNWNSRFSAPWQHFCHNPLCFRPAREDLCGFQIVVFWTLVHVHFAHSGCTLTSCTQSTSMTSIVRTLTRVRSPSWSRTWSRAPGRKKCHLPMLQMQRAAAGIECHAQKR